MIFSKGNRIDSWPWLSFALCTNCSVKKTVVDKDEGPRAGVTAESLGKLKPVPCGL